MDIRKEFIKKHIFDPKKRILELGPLNRPILEKKDFPNCRYCDIRSTEEVKALYSGNAYLEATGIFVETNTIVDIDDVIEGSYSEFYSGKGKFDLVVASHVLEHMDDLISSLLDISGILKPGGQFYIVYPDKRYCFDHFRQSASFRDAYQVFRYGVQNNAPMVLDFFLMTVKENNPLIFWDNSDLTGLLSEKAEKDAFQSFERARKGERMPDVHYWPFTDWDFLIFMYECTRAGLLPYRCIDFMPTQKYDQQFMVLLEYDPDVKKNPLNAERSFIACLDKTIPHFYTAQDLDRITELNELKTSRESMRAELESMRTDLKTTQAELEVTKKGFEAIQSGLEVTREGFETTNRVLEDTRNELKISHSAWENAKDELEAVKNELKSVKAGWEITKAEQIAAENNFKSIEAELAITQNNLTASENNLKAVKGELEIFRVGFESIRSSTIWKITKPLRRIVDMFKHFFHNKGS